MPQWYRAVATPLCCTTATYPLYPPSRPAQTPSTIATYPLDIPAHRQPSPDDPISVLFARHSFLPELSTVSPTARELLSHSSLCICVPLIHSRLPRRFTLSPPRFGVHHTSLLPTTRYTRPSLRLVDNDPLHVYVYCYHHSRPNQRVLLLLPYHWIYLEKN